MVFNREYRHFLRPDRAHEKQRIWSVYISHHTESRTRCLVPGARLSTSLSENQSVQFQTTLTAPVPAHTGWNWANQRRRRWAAASPSPSRLREVSGPEMNRPFHRISDPTGRFRTRPDYKKSIFNSFRITLDYKVFSFSIGILDGSGVLYIFDMVMAVSLLSNLQIVLSLLLSQIINHILDLIRAGVA